MTTTAFPRLIVYTVPRHNTNKRMTFRALHPASARAVYDSWCADSVLDDCAINLAYEYEDGSLEIIETRDAVPPVFTPLPGVHGKKPPLPRPALFGLVLIMSALLILSVFSCTDRMVEELSVPLSSDLANHEIPGSELDRIPAAKAAMVKRIRM